VKVVQRMFGHKSAAVTLDIYGHLFPDDLDTVAERMDSAARESRAFSRTKRALCGAHSSRRRALKAV
jgi:hypothetical protein